MIQSFLEASSSLWDQRLRSALSIVSFAIGIAAIICIQVLGHSMAGAVAGMVGGLTDDELFVHPDDRQANHADALLNLGEIASLKETSPDIKEAFPSTRSSDMGWFGHNRALLQYSGAGSGRFGTVPLLYGRFFSSEDIDDSSPVAIVSNDAFSKLWPDKRDPTGTLLRIGSHAYRVVGVLQEPPAGLVHIDFESAVHLPYTTMEKDYLRGQRTAAVFVLKDARDAATVRPALLAALSSLRPRSLYQIEDRSDITTLVNGLFGGLALVLGFIATISVVVAGVGIMNVMLVSVTERTREIGIRKAIGARPSQIVLQFLSEAILLTLIGATAGVTVGLVAGWLITTRYIVMVSGVIVPIPWKESVLLASGYALAIALTFGTYPAYRASRLDPIDALRYE